MARFTAQELEWKACDATIVPGGYGGTAYADTIKALGERARCALMRAPLDYASPERGEVAIALLRVAAEGPQPRRGAILLNPGGPGDDGLFLALLFGRLWSDVRTDGAGAQFKELAQTCDLVGFSPRGTGAGTRLTCAARRPRSCSAASATRVASGRRRSACVRPTC